MKDEPLLIVIVFLGVLIVGALIFGGTSGGNGRYVSDNSYRTASTVYSQPASASYVTYTTYTTNSNTTCSSRGGSSYMRSDAFGAYRVCNVPGLGECDEVKLYNENVCVVPPYR